MSRTRILAALLPTLALAATPAVAKVTVTFPDPSHYTDTRDRQYRTEDVMKLLEDVFASIGKKRLPEGTDLSVEIVDVDLAGRPRGNMPTEIRIMKAIDRPCIDLKYSLTSDGKVLQSGKDQICDSDYLRTLGPGFFESEPLVFEKRMLDEWLEGRVKAIGKAR